MGESDTVVGITQVFDRLPATIDLRLATSALEIERRMNREVDRLRTLAAIERAATRPREKRIRWLLRDAENIDKLIETDWAARFIWAAEQRPEGVIARTLFREEARRRAIAHRRAMIRAYPGVGARPIWPRAPPIPETRRMRPWVR